MVGGPPMPDHPHANSSQSRRTAGAMVVSSSFSGVGCANLNLRSPVGTALMLRVLQASLAETIKEAKRERLLQKSNLYCRSGETGGSPALE